MSVVGSVQSLWRYPVKSMRGEELEEAFLSFSGVYGDRLFAFTSTAGQEGFPWFTGREQSEMLRYRPRFQDPANTLQPANLASAEGIGPGVTPVFGGPADFAVDVETPSGEVLAIDDPALVSKLSEGLGDKHRLTLSRSDRAMTDCRPLSVFSVQTAQKLGEEIGTDVDPRRFRANVYVDLDTAGGFGEDTFIGRSLRIGSRAVISILERDPRCKMITLDPDTGESNGDVLRAVAKGHGGMAGVYGAVLVEGIVRKGDSIELGG
jgi:uncharacterized protein YcbX